MAFMSVMCNCAGCNRPITCHPELVPSLVIDGKREPICITCVHRWNELHPEAEPFIPHAEAYQAQEVDG